MSVRRNIRIGRPQIGVGPVIAGTVTLVYPSIPEEEPEEDASVTFDSTSTTFDDTDLTFDATS